MKEENKSLGFVSLYRSLLDWEWYQDGNTTRVFIHCLLKANHQPKKWRGITVETGTFISSRGAIAAELGLSDKEVRTALRHLSETGEVASKSTNKYTIYKVENWDLYQSKGQQRASKGPQTTMITMITMKTIKDLRLSIPCRSSRRATATVKFWMPGQRSSR